MITQETAAKIYQCYREIEVSKKLIDECKEYMKNNSWDEKSPRIKDSFGREKCLQLGIPTGDHSTRLFELKWSLAEPVINAHIAEKKSELQLLMEVAKNEIVTPFKE